MAWEPAGGAGGEAPVPLTDADSGGRRHTFPHGGPSRAPPPPPASGVDAVLRELHAGGFTALASGLEGLRPQKNEPTPGVLALQQRYARLPGSPLTAAFSGSLVVAAPLPAPSGGSVQVAVTFDIVQAPSAFCLPVMQKRPWDPPFQVRMTWRSALPLQFSTTVAAFVADESAVPSMLTWQLPAPGEATKQLLDHQQERMVVLAPAAGANGATQQEHCAEAVFTFNKLSFGAPSHMRPRWLVFAASLLGGGCVYSHYLVPTVVMSRLAEQFDKAKAVLWGSREPPSCDSSVMKMDYLQLRKFIKKQLGTVGIQREPSEGDYRYLAARAGFVTSANGVRASSASLEELAAFKSWFGGHLTLLKHIRPHYERSGPQVVCGFGTTREQADALLAPHPAGTFVLRFGSQGGQLVLSVRSKAGPAGPATHYSIAAASLQCNSLEALLERNGSADQLLDTTTGQRHYRTAVLDRSYLQAVDLAEARKRFRQPNRRSSDEAESSSPPEPPRSMTDFQSRPAGAATPSQLHRSASASLGMLQGMPSGPLHSMDSLGATPTPRAEWRGERMDSIATAGSRLQLQPPRYPQAQQTQHVQQQQTQAVEGAGTGLQQQEQQRQQLEQQAAQAWSQTISGSMHHPQAAAVPPHHNWLVAAAGLNPFCSVSMPPPPSSAGVPGPSSSASLPSWPLHPTCMGDMPAPALMHQQQQVLYYQQAQHAQQAQHGGYAGWATAGAEQMAAAASGLQGAAAAHQARSGAALAASQGRAPSGLGPDQSASCCNTSSTLSAGSPSEKGGSPHLENGRGLEQYWRVLDHFPTEGNGFEQD
ncbi:hypothetical protein ABPG75_009072 [Micractinium tetrahymenae]